MPLAALPVSDKSNAVRHIGMMLALLAGVCAYSAYFIGYEKKQVTEKVIVGYKKKKVLVEEAHYEYDAGYRDGDFSYNGN